jgi:arsenite methyltransferase
VRAPGQLIGIDASSGMLAEARRLVDRHGWGNVRLLHGDAAEADLGSPVDAVLFNLSYSVLPDRAPVLRRAWDVLRPGGRLV